MTAPTRPLTCLQGHALIWMDDHYALCEGGIWDWWPEESTYLAELRPVRWHSSAFSALRQARAERDALKSDLEISEQTRRGHHVVMDSQSAEIVQLRAERDVLVADNAALNTLLNELDPILAESGRWGEVARIQEIRKGNHPGAPLLAVVEAATKHVADLDALEQGGQPTLRILNPDMLPDDLRGVRQSLIDLSLAVDALGGRKEQTP